MPGQVEEMPQLSVVEMTEKRLTIDIKPSKGKRWKVPDKMDEEDEEEYEPPSFADIEVIHKHPPPDLHSILKQRSVSESSEDVSNGDPDSPRSECEELSSSFNKKRSVSFSNHVDHASFKSSASVSSMTPALKSKRRRQRKRDEKKNGRVRCNSGGTSSSEECLHSVSDSYSQSEEELESMSKKSKGGKKTVLHRAVSDPGPNIAELSLEQQGEKGSGEPGYRKKIKSKHFDSHMISTDILDVGKIKLDSGESGNGHDSEINGSHSKKAEIYDIEERDHANQSNTSRGERGNEQELRVSNKNQRIVSEIKDRLAEDKAPEKNGQKEDSDDDDFVDAVSSLIEETCEKNSDCQLDKGADDVEEGSSSKPCSEVKTNLIEELTPAAVSEPVRGTQPTPNKDRNDAGDTGSSKHAKSDVETILSWEDGAVGSEHQTKCAFQFSNSLMFDLDVE